MIMMWFSFGTILLSSLFLIDLTRRKFELWSDKKRKGITTFLWVGVGLVAVVTVLFSSETTALSLMEPLTKSLSNPEKYKVFTQNFSSNFVPALWIWGVCSVSILSLLVFVIKGKVAPTLFIAVVAIIGAFDTIRIDRIFVKPVPSAQYVRTDWALKPLQSEMKTSPFRVFVLPGTFNQENAAGLFGLEEITGFHDNELKWYKEFSGSGNNFFTGYVQNGQLIPERMAYGNNFLALANMKYFIGRTNDGLAVLENKNTLNESSSCHGHI